MNKPPTNSQQDYHIQHLLIRPKKQYLDLQPPEVAVRGEEKLEEKLEENLEEKQNPIVVNKRSISQQYKIYPINTVNQ